MPRVLITGANSGIGRATALRLAQDGYDVVAAMRDTGKAEKLLALADEAGVTVKPVELDVTYAESMRRGVRGRCRRAGRRSSPRRSLFALRVE